MLCFISLPFIRFFPISCQACTGICRPEQLCTDQTCHPDTGHRVCALPAPSQPKRRPHWVGGVLHCSGKSMWTKCANFLNIPLNNVFNGILAARCSVCLNKAKQMWRLCLCFSYLLYYLGFWIVP